MRVSEVYADKDNTKISFEFFPPRDDKAAEKFPAIVDALNALKPDYMSVTFGAGGSTKEGSQQTVKLLHGEKKIPTVAYLAGYGLGPDVLTDVLDAYKAMSVETIFVIRGDKPRDKDFSAHPDSFPYASQMLEFTAKRYDFDLGCAGYPEGHLEAESLDKDIENLKRKVDNGAKYVVCQYCYKDDVFFDYLDKCAAAGINVPIIPGIMPVYTVKLTRMLARVCGAAMPPDMEQALERLEGADSADVLAYGVDFAFKQCANLLKHGARALHFYTMDRSPSTTQIVTRLREDNLL